MDRGQRAGGAAEAVPQQKETAWSHPDFTPPLRTFFTVNSGYRFKELGSATIAPAGVDLYTAATGIPGWATSILTASLKGSVFRVKLTADGRAAEGQTIQFLKTEPDARIAALAPANRPTKNRYRDLAISPDGRTVYVAIDTWGLPEGSIVAFTSEGQRRPSAHH